MVTKPTLGALGWGETLNDALDDVDVTNASSAARAHVDAQLATKLATTTAAATYAMAGGLRFAAIGNSIEEGGTNNSTRVLGAKSYVNAMALRSLGRLRLVRNAGVSGETTAQMLTRFSTDITPYGPKVVVVGSAENDLKSSPGLTPAQALAGVVALVDAVKAIGALPVVHTTVPRPSATVTLSNLTHFNVLLKAWAQENGVPLLDFYGLLVDETDGSLYDNAAYHSDGSHPTNAGALVMADHALDVLLPYLPPGSLFLANSGNDPHNLFGDGLMLTDSNADGIPDGYTGAISADVARSLVTATGVPGKLHQMARTGGSTRVTIAKTISTGFSAGDVLAFAYRLQTETSTVAYNGMYGIINGAGGSFKSFDLGTGPIADGVGYYELTVPTGTTSIDCYVASDPGVGTVRTGQWTCRNLTTLGA